MAYAPPIRGRFARTVFRVKGYKNLTCLYGRGQSSLLRRPLTASPTNTPTVNMLYRIFAVLAFAAAYVTAEQHIVSEVTAEKHTVSFDNGSVEAFTPRDALLTPNTTHKGADTVLPPWFLRMERSFLPGKTTFRMDRSLGPSRELISQSGHTGSLANRPS
jgi:hypothetical protein